MAWAFINAGTNTAQYSLSGGAPVQLAPGQAVKDVHADGFVFGGLNNDNVSIRFMSATMIIAGSYSDGSGENKSFSIPPFEVQTITGGIIFGSAQ